MTQSRSCLAAAGSRLSARAPAESGPADAGAVGVSSGPETLSKTFGADRDAVAADGDAFGRVIRAGGAAPPFLVVRV